MKFYKKYLIAGLAIIFGTSLFIPSASATTVGTDVQEGIDYSEQGTVINKNINGNDNAYISGDYVNVPVYNGMYTVNSIADSWLWKTKSNWSPYNNRTTPSLYNYIGETITEYDVESRNEYQYRRWNDEKYKTYSTVYHTKYRGSKWWNCYVTLNEESYNGYGGNKDNFLIIERYTTQEHTGYRGGYDYDYEWRTSEPWRWAWEDHWEAWNVRKSYRYQSRTLRWNENANPGWEQVPLNYSLYDKNNDVINYGIKLKASSRISEDYNTSFLNPTPDNCNFTEEYYYLNIEKATEQFLLTILHSQMTDEITIYAKGLIQSGTSTVSALLELLALQFTENALLNWTSAFLTYANAIILPMNLADIFLQSEKQIEFNALIKETGKMDDYKWIVVKFSKYLNLDEPSLPVYDFEIKCIDSKFDNTDNIESVSMRIEDNRKYCDYPNVYKDVFKLDYYGEVSYINDLTEVENNFNIYSESFDIFDIFSWFEL